MTSRRTFDSKPTHRRTRSSRHTAQRPFAALDKILSKAGFQLLPRPLEAQTGSLAAAEDGNEEELFERAMRDVVRVRWRHDRVPSVPPSPRPASNGDLEDTRLLVVGR